MHTELCSQNVNVVCITATIKKSKVRFLLVSHDRGLLLRGREHHIPIYVLLLLLFLWSEHESNQIKFICDTKQNINEYDIIIRQMCRQDTKAVPTALTGALGSKNTNYNSK